MPLCSRLHLAALLTAVCGALEQEERGPSRSPADSASLWCRCFSSYRSCLPFSLAAAGMQHHGNIASVLVGLLLHWGLMCVQGCMCLK